jgi:hypothetical protein
MKENSLERNYWLDAGDILVIRIPLEFHSTLFVEVVELSNKNVTVGLLQEHHVTSDAVYPYDPLIPLKTNRYVRIRPYHNRESQTIYIYIKSNAQFKERFVLVSIRKECHLFGRLQERFLNVLRVFTSLFS